MRKTPILLIFLIFFSVSSIAYPFWIWTPKSKKWRNPKYSPLASPQSQLEFAKEAYEAGAYKQALVEFRKVVIHFPDAKEAPEAQYHMGKSLQALNRPYEAFKEYQKVIDSYPYSERISQIVDIEYKIGEYFLNKERKKWLGIAIDELFEHPSIEIFKKVIENAPYSESAQAAQYKLGLLYKQLARYEESIDSFKELIEKYPESKWAEPAKYQLALSSARASLGSDYDQELTQEAKEKFQEFIAAHPEAEIAQEAQKELVELQNKEAEKFFSIAEFYYKRKDYKGAQIYYQYVVRNFSQTSWADKSRDILREIKTSYNKKAQ